MSSLFTKARWIPEPYRFSFDKVNGRLIVADVWQYNVEEVDIVTAGGNYGWRIKEGSFLFDPDGTTPDKDSVVTDNSPGSPAGLIVLQHDHSEGMAIVGGFVYHGEAIPELHGK